MNVQLEWYMLDKTKLKNGTEYSFKKQRRLYSLEVFYLMRMLSGFGIMRMRGQVHLS